MYFNARIVESERLGEAKVEAYLCRSSNPDH